MANLIYQITVKDSTSGAETTYDVCLPKSIAQLFSLTGSSGTNLTVGSLKHINFEPLEGSGDIQFKPGDDIAFYSHHRDATKTDEVSLKILDAQDYPVKLQIQAANLTLSTKGKDLTQTHHTNGSGSVVSTDSSPESEIFDVNVNTGNSTGNKKGYLKVRARAIDLRCEEHGGIALQPKGRDSNNFMNKIKFEHGGGDGLEFGTFNTEKSSLFTNEYRFNKDGVVKMATRTTTPSDKADPTDPTTQNKYVKQSDDFYDQIDEDDETATWGDIIKTAATFNNSNVDLPLEGVGGKISTHITSKGNLEIETSNDTKVKSEWVAGNSLSDITDFGHLSTTPFSEVPLTASNANYNEYYSVVGDGNVPGFSRIIAIDAPGINLETDSSIKLEAIDRCVWDEVPVTADNFANYTIQGGLKKDADPDIKYVDLDPTHVYAMSTIDGQKSSEVNITTFNSNATYVRCRQLSKTGGIKLSSDENLSISGKKVTIKGFEGFEGGMDFGETEDGIKFQHLKLTKKGKSKECDILKVEVYNNTTSESTFDPNNYEPTTAHITPASASIPAKTKVVIGQVSMLDIIKFVTWAMDSHYGPWASE